LILEIALGVDVLLIKSKNVEKKLLVVGIE